MPYTRRIVCLAASRKRSAYCFAGKDTASGAWVRPVTTHGEHEVSAAEGTNTIGQLTRVADIIDVDLLRHDPFHFQHENHLIDGSRWRKAGTASYADLLGLVDAPETLWTNGHQSWGYLNNRVPEIAANAQDRSLWLIQPTDLTISVAPKGGMFDDANHRIVTGNFVYGDIEYTMQITDPLVENRMRAGPDRTEALPDGLISVSLAGAYKGYAYKLIAAVIEPF
jgi:hypothetical protein